MVVRRAYDSLCIIPNVLFVIELDEKFVACRGSTGWEFRDYEDKGVSERWLQQKMWKLLKLQGNGGYGAFRSYVGERWLECCR